MYIAIIGQGGHSKVIKDMIMTNFNYKIIGYLDDKFEVEFVEKGFIYGPILSAQRLAESFTDIKFVIAIGDNKMRKSIAETLALPNERYVSVIHKSAVLSPSAKIGHGTVIMPYAVVNANTVIGEHSIINTHSVIEHDCRVGKFVHISPNVTLTGSIEVGEGVHIGAGATVIPQKNLGEWSVIGAGATVINDVPTYCTAVGVPARVKKQQPIGGV